ncbi:hypothetical protein D3C73_1524410 [compost metagenome]
MPVRFRAVITEPAQHINPHLLRPAEFKMAFKSLQQTSRQVLTLMLRRDIPGLVVDAGADNVHLRFLQPVDLGDLMMSVLHTMA